MRSVEEIREKVEELSRLCEFENESLLLPILEEMLECYTEMIVHIMFTIAELKNKEK